VAAVDNGREVMGMALQRYQQRADVRLVSENR
jgi:hypothetical protein